MALGRRSILYSHALGLVIIALFSLRLQVSLAAEGRRGILEAPAPQDHRADDCRFADGVFIHGARRERSVALTFDACPTRHVPGFAPAIVELLAREGIPATFFVSGAWAKAHPHEMDTLARTPLFEIALHGNRHHSLNGESPRDIRAEIEDGSAALRRLHIQPDPLFRPPFGDRPRGLAAIAHEAGVTPVLWDVAPGDPDPAVTAADIEHTVLGQARPGSIVVMHVNGRGVATAAALPALIAGLRQRGFTFTTVGALLRGCVHGASQATDDHGGPP